MVVPDLEQMEIDLPEIQEVDPHVIIKAKLNEAMQHHSGEFIVEDTSLYLDAINGLPGPLIKWFMQTIGREGLAHIAEKLGNQKAQAKTLIGYAKNHEEIYFFEGMIEGRIVQPQGESGFGWDPIFLPNGHEQTFAEMGREAKNSMSMRRIAAEKLRDFLIKTE